MKGYVFTDTGDLMLLRAFKVMNDAVERHGMYLARSPSLPKRINLEDVGKLIRVIPRFYKDRFNCVICPFEYCAIKASAFMRR